MCGWIYPARWSTAVILGHSPSSARRYERHWPHRRAGLEGFPLHDLCYPERHRYILGTTESRTADRLGHAADQSGAVADPIRRRCQGKSSSPSHTRRATS